MSLRQIASYLGHSSLDTTVIYTHLTAVSEERALCAIDALTRQVTPGPEAATSHPPRPTSKGRE